MYKSKYKILILGSSGFIGSQIKFFFENSKNFEIKTITNKKNISDNNIIYVKNFLNNLEKHRYIFNDIDVVINSIGLAHETKDKKIFKKYKEINSVAPIKLYKIANKCGVKTFIHLSSIMVYGNKNYKKPINEHDECAPEGVYANSKLRADKDLINLSNTLKIKLFIIRLPLVLGKDPKGNLSTLIYYCNSNLPLPFKNIKNLKSYITIKTLFDFIKHLITDNKINEKIILISEKDNISIEKLVLIYRKIFNKKNNLFYIHPIIVKILFSFLMKKNLYSKIYNSLYYDTSKFKENYNWEPKKNLEQNLYETLFISLNEK